MGPVFNYCKLICILLLLKGRNENGVRQNSGGGKPHMCLLFALSPAGQNPVAWYYTYHSVSFQALRTNSQGETDLLSYVENYSVIFILQQYVF